VELGDTGSGNLRSCSLITHVNKVSHVTTIDRVAADLGENQDWLFDVACEMDTEDGVIWIRGLGEDVVMAFTDFGIETLVELIKIYKNDPTLLKQRSDAR
jgi:hypothetical protein